MSQKKFNRDSADIIEAIQGIAKHMDERFDQVDKRFDEVDKRLDRIEFRVNGQDQRISVLEDRMRQVATKVGLTFSH